jgi:hypothetical protein
MKDSEAQNMKSKVRGFDGTNQGKKINVAFILLNL